MSRTTNVPVSKARRKKRNKLSKGFTGKNKNTNRITAGVLKRALANQFKSRKLLKRDMRSLWITRIGIAARNFGTNYSSFMKGLKKADILINRKMLSELAVRNKTAFSELVKISSEML